jgi:hypothetical protein
MNETIPNETVTVRIWKRETLVPFARLCPPPCFISPLLSRTGNSNSVIPPAAGMPYLTINK